MMPIPSIPRRPMKQQSKDLLMWLYTILCVPVIIIITFWLNGYLGFRL
jgi:hypothetical protein